MLVRYPAKVTRPVDLRVGRPPRSLNREVLGRQIWLICEQFFYTAASGQFTIPSSLHQYCSEGINLDYDISLLGARYFDTVGPAPRTSVVGVDSLAWCPQTGWAAHVLR